MLCLSSEVQDFQQEAARYLLLSLERTGTSFEEHFLRTIAGTHHQVTLFIV